LRPSWLPCGALRNDRSVADAAIGAMRELAARSDGYHCVPLTDALIAAAAAEHGGLAVLHRDAHFDRLAEVLVFQSVELPVPQITEQAAPGENQEGDVGVGTESRSPAITGLRARSC